MRCHPPGTALRGVQLLRATEFDRPRPASQHLTTTRISCLQSVMTSSYASSLHHTAGHPAGHPGHHHQLHGRFARSSAAVTPSGMVASVIEAAPSPSPFTPPDYSLFDSSTYHQSSESRSSNYLPPLFGVPPLFAHQQQQSQQAPISSARSSPATSMFASSSTAAGAAPVAPSTAISRPSSTTLVGTTPVPPSLLNNGALDTLLFYQGTPSDSSPESLFVQVPAKENESGVTGGHEFWVNVPWRAIINGGKLFQHREVVNELLDQIAQTPALRQRALQLLGAGHGAGYGYGAPPYTPASSSINMRSNSNDGTPFSSNGQGDFNLLTSSPWIGSNGTSSSNEEGGLFSPATAASFWNSSSSPDMNRSAGAGGAGNGGPHMFGALPVSLSLHAVYARGGVFWRARWLACKCIGHD
jgi:hypothetical protein